MKYRELAHLLDELTPEQLDCDITVELSQEQECLPGEFRITDIENDLLDENHPVIFVK